MHQRETSRASGCARRGSRRAEGTPRSDKQRFTPRRERKFGALQQSVGQSGDARAYTTSRIARIRPVGLRENGWVMKKIRKDEKRVKSPNEETAVPVPSRLGFLRGELDVPDDFDRMGEKEIAALFDVGS